MPVGEEFFNRKRKELGVSLNDVQKRAVLNIEGPLLLLASPGSGKTTTLIMKIGYLIEEVGLEPARIKAVTFSNASANDMKERYQRFFPTLPPVEFSTIHSLAFQVVREYFYKKQIQYHIIEGSDPSRFNKKLLLRDLFKAVNHKSITDEQLEELLTYISLIKNKLVPQDKWSTISCDVPNALQIFQKYERFKRSGTDQLLVDYDDMLTIANQAFGKDHAILAKYQQKYDYLLTDESQDTSFVQHAIIEKLVQKHQNLCVVADDDQSIYSWRAAEPQYLLNFQKVYPDAQILMMEQNYRSSQDIVSVANTFIKQNKNRYNKNMFTENPTHTPITLKTLADYQYQSNYLIDQISKEENLREIAVLYRNNASSILLLDALDKAHIPFYMKDANNRFFSHWIVEDILNFMRLSYDVKRVDIFERIYSKFHLYLKKSHIQQLKRPSHESVFDRLLKSTDLQEWQKEKVKAYQSRYHQMQKKTPFQVILMIREEFGYEKVMKKMSEKLGFKMDYLLEVLNTLEEIAKSTQSMVEFANRLDHLASLLKTSKYNKQQNAITLSTFHSAKGLEFAKVYMIDLIKGVIPTQSEEDQLEEGKSEEMEEAVRLFYVGMTRAKTHLELLSYSKRFGKKVSPSKFVRDVKRIISPEEFQKSHPTKTAIPKNKARQQKNGNADQTNAIKDPAKFLVGLKIKHRIFGIGEITYRTDDTMKIRFEKYSKTLSVDTCLEHGLIEAVDSIS
ncbi:ATP-dependent helicase [Lederbergia galactosidilytica]|uniref:DNA 3'-5' helicase n=1 Tax=Lederbergia galactosidilytica TaxID=217031 RepID=A0A177ZIX2_9BACI|nr:ATP-dependent helicase [Lederbergia galactosidilytica]OAK67300.1 helicase UvrD [Lederbergia galactosidilytica]